MRQEPGPALDPDAMRRVERLPLGADRLAPKLHAGLLWRAVRLAGIAADARGDAVGPGRHTPLRAGHDVVDRDRLGAGLRPQYWQVWWSRLATFRRLNVTADPGRRS